MIKSYIRGHIIILKNDKWIYEDTGESVFEIEVRPCKRCGKVPTPEGYDACLGYIPNVISACCGHGIEKKFIKYKVEKK